MSYPVLRDHQRELLRLIVASNSESATAAGLGAIDAWCSRCQRDAAWRENDSAEGCDILSRTFAYNIGDPEYPVEWIEDDVPYPEHTNPRCTAFVEIGKEGSTYCPDERQGELAL